MLPLLFNAIPLETSEMKLESLKTRACVRRCSHKNRVPCELSLTASLCTLEGRDDPTCLRPVTLAQSEFPQGNKAKKIVCQKGAVGALGV